MRAIQGGKAKLYTEVLRAEADVEVCVRWANRTFINFLTYGSKVFDESYLKTLHQKVKNNALTHGRRAISFQLVQFLQTFY